MTEFSKGFMRGVFILFAVLMLWPVAWVALLATALFVITVGGFVLAHPILLIVCLFVWWIIRDK